MNRLRIFKEGEMFYIRRLVRKDWLDVVDERGNVVCTDTYEKAVDLLEIYINK